MPASAEVARVTTGPAWTRNPDGSWALPGRTLGWDVLEWTDEYLRQPDGPEAGNAWNYTDEQMRLLLWWYAIDEAGRFVYRYGMLRRVKGWGKDPFAATLCAAEFVGPCRFDGWDADGTPVARPHAASWVTTAAVAKDQTKNTMSLFPGLFSPAAISDYRIDLGKEIIYAMGGTRRLEAVTQSPRTFEGGRQTFTLKNETQHWLANNDGHDMAEVIARNATKSRDGASRVLAISNAHEPGEDSDAEHDWEAWRAVQDGRATGAGVLYDSLEAGELDMDDEEQLRSGLRAARGDSLWLGEDRHVEEINDPRSSRASSARFYLNHVVPADAMWIKPDLWDACLSGAVPEPGTRITIGVDGARFVDALAIIATDVKTGFQWPLGIWQRPEHADDEYEHPMDEVDSVMVDALSRWDVWRVYIDPGSSAGNITPLVEKWQGRWGAKRVIEWFMNRLRQTALSVASYADAVATQTVNHGGDPAFGAHVKNAVRRKTNMVDDEGKPLYVITKERPGSPRKIDAAAAAVLSWEARSDCVAAGETEARRYRAVGF